MIVQLSYYPGCSLHGSSSEYDHSIQAVCRALEIDLKELDDWTCCGASSAHALDESLSILLAAKNIDEADKSGRDLMVGCAACFSRLKFAEKAMAQDPRRWAESGKAPSVKIVHIHDLLARPDMLKKIQKLTVKPLKGINAIPYYGCLTARPPKVVDAQNPENPQTLDELLKAIGANVTPWSRKTDCCGGSFTISKTEIVLKLSGDLFMAAKHAGGDCIVTDCPMCQANLDSREKEIAAQRGEPLDMPVFFITELIALAFGIDETKKWFSKHLVDPRPLLAQRASA
jgi:heterodisulfide reductase subunit B2